MTSVKLVVVGPAAGGKSALVHAYMYGQFIDKYDPTIEDTYLKPVVDGTGTFQVEIIDTAGIETFSIFRKTAVAGGQGFLLCVALDRQIVDKEMDVFIDDIFKTKEAQDRLADTVVAITGTKSDLVETRAITEGQLNALASQFESQGVGHVRVFETSAKNLQIEEPFSWSVDTIRAARPTAEQPKTPRERSFCSLI